MGNIHSTAIVHPGAVLGEGTTVGAFSIIGENVRLGEGCTIQEHVVLRGHTSIGTGVTVFPFALVGGEPQHLKYRGEPTRVEIGDRTVIRESVTIHVGTDFGNKVTRIGHDTFIMAYCHVAHDCVVGNHVIIANGTQLAGHTEIQDFCNVGGMCAITQFSRVGRYCYIGGASVIRKDLPPFTMGKGNVFEVQGINSVGLTRAGFAPSVLAQLKALYKIFYLQHLTADQAIEKIIAQIGPTDEVKVFLDFVRESKVGFVR